MPTAPLRTDADIAYLAAKDAVNRWYHCYVAELADQFREHFLAETAYSDKECVAIIMMMIIDEQATQGYRDPLRMATGAIEVGLGRNANLGFIYGDDLYSYPNKTNCVEVEMAAAIYGLLVGHLNP